MKIIHVLPNSKIGGVQSFVADLAHMQKNQKQNVSLVFLVSDLNLDVRFSSIKIIKYNNFIKNFIMGKYKNTIIHTHGHVLTIIGYLSIFCKCKKVIHTVHNTPIYEAGYYRRFLHKFLYKRNFVMPVSISKKLLKQFNLLYELSSQNYIINGVSSKRSISYNSSQLSSNVSKIDILFVGRLDYQKNLNLLLKSLDKLNNDLPWHLHVVGKDYGFYDKELFTKMINDKKITYYGELQYVSNFLCDADLLVQPSLFEGVPILLLEAKLVGLQVLLTDVGGCSEIIGEDDFLCDISANQMAKVLGEIICDYLINGKSKSYSKIDISIDRCWKEYVKIYET